MGYRKVINTCQALLHIKQEYSSSEFVIIKLRKDREKDILTKKGLLPASFDTYQMVKDGIIVFRFTDLQNDHKSLRVGLAKEEGIISPAYVCVQCENVLPEFLYLQLHTFDLRKVFYTMGDGMRQTLSYSDIKDMDVFVPSMEEQHRIVTFSKALISRFHCKLYN